ncbi:carbohydrate ABC transporter permease [Paenibacillus agaridevorans]|uniref:carbohydrate ABC transporter permease n=1 Tax=Paenibacillus agaridevorans TaxID=171404 RepID=UPI001BE4CD8C|nr:carbohydrate ABC transporter permease [Paenibacillus agaridevorans]
MRTRTNTKYIFPVVNGTILGILALTCLAPLVHIFAIAFSDNNEVVKGAVTLWPKSFTLSSFNFVLERQEFWQAFGVTLKRIAIGLPLNMLLTIITAYPLSKESLTFRPRTFYVWFMFFTMLFAGGLIPTYMLVRQLNMLDSIWALVLPGALQVYNVILLLNFFRQLPKEISEAAYMDGAGHWQTLWKIYVPTSMAALATLILFTVVGHWNAWFDGMIYMNMPEKYPLQTFLRTVITMPDFKYLKADDWKNLQSISDRTTRSAQIIIASVPILLVYPFLQKYFVKGIVLGSVKG